MKDALALRALDCFATFPFPAGFEDAPALEAAGRAYHDCRAEADGEAQDPRQDKTYNRFHKPTHTAADIKELRRLHAEMDRAVLSAYGWTT